MYLKEVSNLEEVKNKYLQIRLSEAEYEKLKELAERKGVKMADILRSVLYQKGE